MRILRILNFRLKKIKINIWNNFFLGAVYLGRVVIPTPKVFINLPWTYKKFTVKEKHIGSAVSEFLSYRKKGLLLYKILVLFPFRLLLIIFFKVQISI